MSRPRVVWPPIELPQGLSHGLHAYNNLGCRCVVCAEAKSVYKPKRRTTECARVDLAPPPMVDRLPSIPCAHLRDWR